jgi:hypothetical protein
MTQSEQVLVGASVFTQNMYQHQDSQLKTKVEELIEPFVKNFIIKNYPKVNKFSVGAIRSKGGRFQYELTGVYHLQ